MVAEGTRPKVVAFVGLPGSGRVEAVEVARELDVPVVAFEDVIRQEINERGLDPAEKQSEVALELRNEKETAALAKQALPMLDEALADSDLAVVDGVRSVTAVETFEMEFGEDFLLVSVEAPFDVRLERLADGTETDSGISREDLEARDRRERGFGLGEVIDRAEATIDNTKTQTSFRKRVVELLETLTGVQWSYDPLADSEPADSVPNPDDEPITRLDGDELDRAAYARYLAGRISSVSHSGAYSIHLHGPWGSGKSTLLNFLERLLSGTPEGAPWHSGVEERAGGGEDDRGAGSQAEEWLVVRFNAWQNQHLQPPWWSLMDHVYRQGKGELSRRDRGREWAWRLTSGRSAVLLTFVVVAWAIAIASFFLASAPDGSGLLATVSGVVSDFSPIVAVLVSVWAGIETVSDSLLFGSARAAESYVKSTGDPMNSIQDRFETLIERIPMPVAVFVDDLDRCESEYVVGLLNGIQTLFADAQVVFVVAADEQWLNACFEKQYEDQKEQVKTPGKSLGELFLEKLFQLSFPVPDPPGRTRTAYWESLLRVDADAAADGVNEMREEAFETMRAAENETEILENLGGDRDRSAVEDRLFREEAVIRLADPEILERTEHVLQPFTPLLEPNPRSMKQFVNAYSVNRALATLSDVEVDREGLALWTVLAVRWPKLADYVEENPGTVKLDGQGGGAEVDDEEIRTLLETSEVRETIAGKPVAAELDEDVVDRCSVIHP